MIREIQLFVLHKMISEYWKTKTYFNLTAELKTSVYTYDIEALFLTGTNCSMSEYQLAIFSQLNILSDLDHDT